MYLQLFCSKVVSSSLSVSFPRMIKYMTCKNRVLTFVVTDMPEEFCQVSIVIFNHQVRVVFVNEFA